MLTLARGPTDSVDRSTLARLTRNDLGLAERLADEIRAGILAADGKDATQWLSIAGELVLVDDDVQVNHDAQYCQCAVCLLFAYLLLVVLPRDFAVG